MRVSLQGILIQLLRKKSRCKGFETISYFTYRRCMTEVEVKDINMIANILVSDLPPDSLETSIDPTRVV